MNKILCGDALDTLKTLESGSVQTCVTSPPYYSLRDYGVEGQIGLEETPELYIARLVEVFREVRRVLRDDGTLWVNIGDSYNGSQMGYNNNGTWQDRSGTKQGTNKGALNLLPTKIAGLKPKNLIGIPWMLAFALRADGWYLRSDIIWAKPNCMPESVEDRPTKSHEYIFLLSKQERYYYDADAIVEPSIYAGRVVRASMTGAKNALSRGIGDAPDGAMRTSWGFTQHDTLVSSSRNKRSVWTVATSPYSEAHFATFPPKLIEPCILAGSAPGDIVLDPFMGAGTVALVALQYSRAYLGIELNPEYVELINARIAAVQPDLWEATA